MLPCATRSEIKDPIESKEMIFLPFTRGRKDNKIHDLVHALLGVNRYSTAYEAGVPVD